MSIYKDLRERLGLTQQELADYADVPRSTYSLVEIGRRSLKTKSVIKIGYFEVILADEKLQEVNVLNAKEAETAKSGYRELLEKRIDDCKYEQLTLQRKLEQVVQDYNAAEKLLKLTAVFFDIYPERKEIERDWRWMAAMRVSAEEKYIQSKLLLKDLELNAYKIKCELEKAIEMLDEIR